ncbi:hypothetical protein HZF05_17680 [Sphingomonas sp. CGMCC 1.13654]|uniref:PDZ domain-containing protein n=1 Tax=Sphingomonas chungangi TaxID=2683589 RepID=A0A838L9Q2_9SPHN|nr:hypothetical protein [Sphingomonas chungangi]MBA2935914.1 hypothetical protein [Sphingomonas chungangi]MVW54605.1 hypothetical protein [Sphingomonas chungangi]
MARRFSLPDALPPLRGSAATVYAILWLPLLAIALWLAVGAAWYGVADGAGDAYSWHALGINRDPGDGALIDRIAGDELRRADVRRGDRILAFDGIPMPQGATSDVQDWRIKAHLLDARGPIRLLLRRGKDQPRIVSLTRSTEHGDALMPAPG